MTESESREEICRIGRSLFERGYMHATAGNISVRLDDGGFLITPTDACIAFLDPAKLARLDAQLNQTDGASGTRRPPPPWPCSRNSRRRRNSGYGAASRWSADHKPWDRPRSMNCAAASAPAGKGFLMPRFAADLSMLYPELFRPRGAELLRGAAVTERQVRSRADR
jgi:hypothetical protein